MKRVLPVGLVWALIALVSGVVIALLAPADVVWLDAGSPGDNRYLAGFGAAEVNDHETFRWSKDVATLTLPVPGEGRYRVDMAIAAIKPADRVLNIACGGTATAVPLRERPGNSDVSFECESRDGELAIDLTVPAIPVPREGRTLGVSVRHVRAERLDGSAFTLSRLWLVASVAGSIAAAGMIGVILGARTSRLLLPGMVVLLWAALVVAHPDWLRIAAGGPGSLVAVTGAAAAMALSSERRFLARLLSSVGLLIPLLVDQPVTALLVPARWNVGDDGALRLLPWLAAGVVLVAALRGTRPDRFLALAGASLGLIAVVMPLVAKRVLERWSATIAVPDWTDRASIVGAIYLAAIALIVVVGVLTSRREAVWPVLLVVALALVALAGWRMEVMNFNGDEPHYYVTARSLGSDLDLELLNNYHEASYRRNTISPDGNIAVQRDATADRYSPLTPPSGRTNGEATIFGGLPRDRYASRNVVTELEIHNPAIEPARVEVTLGGTSPDEVSTAEIEVEAGTTESLLLRTAGFETLRIGSGQDLEIEASARVWAGKYPLPAYVPLTDWAVPVHAAGGRDAGVWVSLLNNGEREAQVSVLDRGRQEMVSLCAGCATTTLLEAGDSEQLVALETLQGEVSVAAVAYEERTGELHFDPGLPLLAAPFARFGHPKVVLAVPVLATLSMLPGLALLLRRVGVDGRMLQLSVVGVALLAPVSTYSVRLYTEIVAVCLLVWALVFWDLSARRTLFLIPLGGLALIFPILHGRYVVFSASLGLLLIMRVVALVPTMSTRVIGWFVVVTLGTGLSAVAVLQLAVGLRQRVTASYIATNWADVNLIGLLLDRGSGLIPFAPWVLLAWFVPRPLHPLQRAALGLALVQLAAVIVRAGGWQTWGAPGRYILPVVPLLVLLVAPAVQHLWSEWRARPALVLVGLWSIAMTFMLHWLPLSGYVRRGRYLVDEAWHSIVGVSPMVVFPRVVPSPGSFVAGSIVTVGILIVAAWLLMWPVRRPPVVEDAQPVGDQAMDSS